MTPRIMTISLNRSMQPVSAAPMDGAMFSPMPSTPSTRTLLSISIGAADADGMQTGRGHRQAIMALDGDYMNVGIAMVPEENPNTGVGPLVTTGNYCGALESLPDHYNRFLVGTVWSDQNGNGLYDPGEGMSGVQVTPDQGSVLRGDRRRRRLCHSDCRIRQLPVSFGGPISRQETVTVNEVSVLLDASPSPSGHAGVRRLRRPPPTAERPAPVLPDAPVHSNMRE